MTDEPQLLPCPFCGTRNPQLQEYGPCSDEEDYTEEYLSTHTFFSYRCSNTLCWAESAKCYPEAEAAKAWNNRIPRLQPDDHATMSGIMRDMQAEIDRLKVQKTQLMDAVAILLGDRSEYPCQHYTDRVKFARAVLATVGA